MASPLQKLVKFAGKPPLSGGNEQDNNPNPLEDKGLNILTRVMTYGCLAIILVSCYVSLGRHSLLMSVSIAGLSAFIALVSGAVGGLLGFLFGIPLSKQGVPAPPPISTNTVIKSGTADVPTTTASSYKTDAYGNNTNLEQISDWLTKIIVGVSLTQLHTLQAYFEALVASVSAGFSEGMRVEFARPYAGSLIIFFAICGFLFVYLWAKIYLKAQLLIADRDIDRLINSVQAAVVKEVTSQVKTKDNKADIDRINQKIEQFNRQRQRITVEEEKPEFKPFVDKAKPGPISVFNDAQKNRWGGLSASNGLAVAAVFDLSGKESVDQFYNVILSLTSTDITKPLTGQVFFFLHDSFNTKIIQSVTAANNYASIQIGSYEAFTVGVFADATMTKLELDLNLAPNAPEDYKYSDKLPTIEELRAELERLRQDG